MRRARALPAHGAASPTPSRTVAVPNAADPGTRAVTAPTHSQRPARWAAIDLARGVAIVAVVAFHTTWDLGNLRLIRWNIGEHFAGTALAHTIAGTFLVLTGASLVLAHGRRSRWPAFWRRELKLVACALLLTAASWVYQPREVITFGILHSIAAASLLVLPAMRGPRWTAWAAALVAVALPWMIHLPGRSSWSSWTGLADGTRPTLDWQPVLPWLALAFAGVGVMRWLLSPGRPGSEHAAASAKLRSWQPAFKPARWVATAGRHTLAIYLLHQPIVFGVLWLVARSRA
ncbi:DUF1624 domain-containing protein [Flexivirga caeni]|uniref:DUF1624 domain-containing protein n=1 Tax=Flexivirga caeni TaxID=2294115 RepID=UPI0013157FC5|nr:heparan-alpha-glucosaminide N-acetyltransferase [Flexivirga caeni]